MRSELYLLLRSRGLWLLVVSCGAIGALRVVFERFAAESERATQALSSALAGSDVDLEAPIASNAYGPFADALSTGFFFAQLACTVIAAYSFASSGEHGLTRHLLIRSVGRVRLMVSKYLGSLLVALACFSAVAVGAGISASICFDFGPVMEDGFELLPVEEIHQELWRGVFGSLAAMPAALAFGLLFSVACRSSALSIGAVLGSAVLFDATKEALGPAARYVYAYHLPALVDRSYLAEVPRIVRGFSDIVVDEEGYWMSLWVPWPQVTLFAIVSLLIVQRRRF